MRLLAAIIGLCLISGALHAHNPHGPRGMGVPRDTPPVDEPRGVPAPRSDDTPATGGLDPQAGGHVHGTDKDMSEQRMLPVSGGAIYWKRQKYRLAGVNVPESYAPECRYENQKGSVSFARLEELLREEVDRLEVVGGNDGLGYTWAKVILKDGRDLADVLAREGHARRMQSGEYRKTWCKKYKPPEKEPAHGTAPFTSP